MFGSRPESLYLKQAPPKRLSLPAAQRLNTILERDQQNAEQQQQQQGNSTELPLRIQNARHSYLGAPPLLNDEKPPPRYSALSAFSASSGSGQTFPPASSQSSRDYNGRQEEGNRGALAGFRGSLTRRGGWKKLAIIAAVLLLIIIGLAVGLGVGLTRRNSNNSAQSGGSGNSTSSTGPAPFPAGEWTFDVVLGSVDTSCTPDSQTWTCPPYQTYEQSPTASRFSFTWNISQTPANQFSISSGRNVFAPTFGPAPLSLMSAGTADERYSFSITMSKSVQPSPPITSNGEQAVCYFNHTILSGTLYTGMKNTTGSPVNPQTWPGTAYISQASPGGMSVPDCYSSSGSHVSLAAQPADSRCACIYESRNSTGAG